MLVTILQTNQELAAASALIMERLWPALNQCRDLTTLRYPDAGPDASEEDGWHFLNGAICGVVTQYAMSNGMDDPDTIASMCGACTAWIDETMEDDGDFDAAVRRLVPDAFTAGGVTS